MTVSEFKVGDVVELTEDFSGEGVKGLRCILDRKWVDGDWLMSPVGGGAVQVVKEESFRLVRNSPVRTETIKRTVIEPGVYGRLELRKSDDGKMRATLTSDDISDGMWDLLSSDEWRELARIATELAEGLDAQ
jgi:hypothetical protein